MIKDTISKAIYITLAFVIVSFFFLKVVPMIGEGQGTVIKEMKKVENY